MIYSEMNTISTNEPMNVQYLGVNILLFNIIGTINNALSPKDKYKIDNEIAA